MSKNAGEQMRRTGVQRGSEDRAVFLGKIRGFGALGIRGGFWDDLDGVKELIQTATLLGFGQVDPSFRGGVA